MTTLKKSVLTIACLMAATVANAASGHIYDIRPYYDDAIKTGPMYSADKPMTGGDVARFTVRVACEAAHTGDNDYKWYAEYTGHGSAAEAWVSSPMTIGIFVSGRRTEAKLVRAIESESGNDYTDLIFEYTVRPGDFALPIVLSDADQNPMAGTSSETHQYYIRKNNWVIRNAKGDEANLWFGLWTMVQPAGAAEAVNDYDLRGAGFYAKTIGFDAKWVEVPTKSSAGIWREVREGSTYIKGKTESEAGDAPTLALTVAATNSVTLHVWSDNSAAVVVTNTTDESKWYPVVMNLDKDGTLKATNTVLDVKVEAGLTEIPFEILGVKSNETANLVLSASTNYSYNASGIRYEDYVTVPVTCVEKKGRGHYVTAAVDGGLEEVAVSTNYTKSVGTLTVAVATGYTNDVTVTVTPRLRDGTSAWSNYVHLADAETVGKWDTRTPFTYTIPKSEISTEAVDELHQTIYIFAMGADDHTSLASAGIVFDVTLDEAASNYYGKAQSGSILYFKPTAPVITSPADGAGFQSLGNKTKEFEIKVADSYKNICDTNTGYQIWYKRKATDTSYTRLDTNTVWALDTYGVLRDGGGKGDLPGIKYVSAGTYKSEFYLIAPDGVSKSDVLHVTVTVSKPAQVWMTTELDNEKGNEGTNVVATISLSDSVDNVEGYDDSVYAFLLPLDEASSNLVECSFLATNGNIGVEIAAGETESETAEITFLDGGNGSRGTGLKYEIVLLKNDTWNEDENEEVEGFRSDKYKPTVYNVRPFVRLAKMKGVAASSKAEYTVRKSGGTMGKTVSIGVTNVFSFSVYEPGEIDLSTTNEGQRFELQYTIQESNGSGDTQVLYGDPANTNFQWAFQAKGTATVLVQVRDKDMMSNDEWSDEFVFYVNVSDSPSVYLASESGSLTFNEDGIGARKAALTVNLTANTATVPLDVEISVASSVTNANEGALVLGGCDARLANGNYRVTFQKGATSRKIYVTEADGTKISATKGFTVTARVSTTSTNPDGTRWCDYYLTDSNFFTVDNVPPTLVCSLGAPNSATNGFIIAKEEEREIKWSVDDVAADLGRYDEHGKYSLTTNITVALTATSGSNNTETNVCDSSNHVFRVKFSESGVQSVTITATDKDADGGNGTTTRTWYFDVQSSKTLVAFPVRPHGGATSYATKYNSQLGIGKGHIWVNGATISSVDMFQQKWDCKLSGDAEVYAWGYKSGAYDDGTLNGHDIPIATDGKKTSSGQAKENYYHYTDARDSFLYLWIKYGASETTTSSGGSSSTASADTATIGKIAMEVWDGTATATPGTYVPSLPTEADETGNYANTYVEAIFSKEYLVTDNMGDINFDGLPDLYVQKWKFDVFDGTTAELTGDDTARLDDYNDDGDYLPGKTSAVYSFFVPADTNSAAIEAGTPFTAVQELRGGYQDSDQDPNDTYWSALNDACDSPFVGIAGVKVDKVYADPTTCATSTLTRLEWAAWVKLGKPEKWSPECPTDPTKWDSDGDNLSDGYEYYYWYRAHVGYFEGGNTNSHAFMTGRKFNPADPCGYILIPSETIEREMNPQLNVNHAETDSDNDGLSDLEESVLGTNPFDFDSDGDGLPDGYEVVLSQTDPLTYETANGDALANPDGDAMAFAYTESRFKIFGFLTDDGTVAYRAIDRHALGFEGYLPVTAFTTNATTRTGGWKISVLASAAVTNAYYASVQPKTFTDADGTVYLTEDLPAEKVFALNADGSVGMPAYLPCGTVLAAAPEPGTAKVLSLALVKTDGTVVTEGVVPITEALPPTRLYAAFRYGDPAFANDEDKPEYGLFAVCGDATIDCSWPIVYDSEKDETIREDIRKLTPVYLIHHIAYQLGGFDPRAGWKAGNANSRAFNTYDEYLAFAFHINVNARGYKGGFLAVDYTPTLENPYSTIWATTLTDPLKADTDDDGMPDGWELYVMAGPQTVLPKPDDLIPCLAAVAPTDAYGPLSAYGSVTSASTADADGLDFIQEFCGVDSLAAYPSVETIQNSLRATEFLASGWRNKKYPTDPWNADTDDDGVDDGAEGKDFVYGEATATGAEGGGLNPCSWDTDLDGLPDPFEIEFKGSYTAGATTSVSNLVRTGGAWDGGMDGTHDDANDDYDRDGLLNWQEYLVGTMRAWRYDDTFSSWAEQSFDSSEIENVMGSDEDWGKYWYERLVCEPDIYDKHKDGKAVVTENPADGSYEYNPRLVSGIFDAGATYFSLCTNEWDAASGSWYYFRDGVYHDLKNPSLAWADTTEPKAIKQWNRFSWWAYKLEPMTGYPFYYKSGAQNGLKIEQFIYPTKYICCDPTKSDTDNDGMDDYYELFHGLNPLLGQSATHDDGHRPPVDIVYIAYGGGSLVYADSGSAVPVWSAENNFWLNSGSPNNASGTGARLSRTPVSKNGSTFDFVAYPWLSGLAYADVDGDDIRNQEEAIMPNLQSRSSWHHTDPTPLWLTDSSYAKSLTHRYYRPVSALGWQILRQDPGNIPYFTYDLDGDGEIDPKTEMWDIRSFPGYSWTSANGVKISPYTLHKAWGPSKAIWSFEENEGYDSDHDYLSDYEEAQGKTKPASDPQDSDDPLRRQAMWFDGKNSFLQTPIAQSEIQPVDTLPIEPELPFLYFTVECWARPDDACDLTKPQTLVERAIWTGNSNTADEQWLRKNFLIGIRDGKWYAKYDSSGTGTQPVEVTDDNAVTTNWTHIAATYDGVALKIYVNGVCNNSHDSSVAPAHGTWSATIDDAGALRDGKTTYTYSSLLVGASAKDFKGVIFDYTWRINPLDATTTDDYENYFHGYIDEVRVWDGARSQDEIQAARKTRFTSKECAANRTACYEAWLKNAAFEAGVTGAKAARPAELRAHYTFDHLPGATRSDWVLKTPAGFTTASDETDARAKHWSRPDGYANPWWNSVHSSIASAVYTDRAWVPWIGNTVAHLPRPDGTTLDSMYWSADYAGAKSAADCGYASFDFPMTAEYVSKWTQMGYVVQNQPPNTTPTRYELVKGDSDLLKVYSFTLRHRDSEGDDLLPFGGAFPKRITGAEGGMWDGQGAADAWAQTGTGDADNDGLPDWWTQYALERYNLSTDPTATISWETLVNYDGVRMTAGQAYLRDLAKGMLPDTKYHADDLGLADTRDLDNDGMPDWWEEIYLGVNQTGTILDRDADLDYDGLSNYNEYRLDVLGLMPPETNLQLKLDKEFSNGTVYDYFRTNGLAGADRRYAGFMVTDHDLIEDSFETEPERKVYSTHLDPEGNGWSKWSEARALHNENTWQLVGYKTVLTTVEFAKGSDELNFFAATNTGDIIMREYKQEYDGSYYQETVDGESDTGTLIEYKAGDWVSENDYVFAGSSWTAVRYTIQTEEPIYKYGGKPTPRVNVTLWGNLEEQYYETTEVQNAGTTNATTNTVWKSHSLYVEAYRGYDLSEAYWWGYIGDIEEENGKMTASIDGEGLEEGLNTFVLRNGDIYGFATANVGYDHVDLEVGLEERSAVIPSGIYGGGERTVIRRIAINGYDCQTRPVWAGSVDGYVTAAAILQNFKNGAIDLDAKYLVKDAAALGFAADEIRSATYEILRTYTYEDDETSTLESNSYAWQTFEKEFSLTRPTATPVSPTAASGNRVRTHKPVFKFTGLDGCTAFVLEIATNADDKAVILAATNILPTAWTSAGKSVREFKSDFQIGEGLDLADKSNYFWRVCGLNAKWPTAVKWSDWASFQTAVESANGATGYGKLAAEVRYYGAATNEISDVIVGVFTDVAFAGKPVASARLKSGTFADLAVAKPSATHFEATAQVTFDGLEPGSYYVMAFNDRNGNGQRDAYESWGYLNKIGSQVEDRFTPVSLTVEANMGGTVSSGVVFMEDTDVNDNGLPDCIEDEARLVAATKVESVDGDGDGLDTTDDYWNEYVWGCDPEEWDTDGDNLPDGYEVWAGLDPFSEWDATHLHVWTGTNGVTSSYVYGSDPVEGDVMAYAMVTRRVLTVSNRTDKVTYRLAVDEDDLTDYRVGQNMPKKTFQTVGFYAALPSDEWNDYTSGDYYTLWDAVETTADDTLVGIEPSFDVMLVHWQVFDAFGFESGVATPSDATKRSDGKVHTRPMYDIDKYLVARLLGNEDRMNAQRLWGRQNTCLKPGVVDFDADGIPDGWELYVRKGYAQSPNSDGTYISPWVNRDGWKADGSFKLSITGKDGKHTYLTDPEWTLAEMYNNGVNPANPYDANSLLPGTGIDDKTVRTYGLTDQDADGDHDGLSNLQEYNARTKANFTSVTNLDITVAITDDHVLDYFRTNGLVGVDRRYLGEVVADHDFIEDDWEDLYDDEAISRTVYDPLDDVDADGWSNWAEARAGTDPSREAILSLVKSDLSEDHALQAYPTPTVYTKVSYQTTVPLTASIIVQAWKGETAAGTPDAMWTVPGSGESSDWNTRFLGLAPNVVMNFNIGPGDISQHHVQLEFYDPNYYIENYEVLTNGTKRWLTTTVHDVDSADWGNFHYGDDPTDTTYGRDTGTFAFSSDDSEEDGETLYRAGETVDDSWVNYKNGDIRIDFTSDIFRQTDVTGLVSIETGSGEVKEIHHVPHYNFTRAFWRVRWMGRMTATANMRTFSLSEPDEFSDASFGHLKEGKNTFFVFADLNGSGTWDEGEPFGYKKGVEVGYDKVPELAIELTDEAAVLRRIALTGISSGSYLSVRRTAINGQATEGEPAVWTGRVPARGYLTEADLISSYNGYVFDTLLRSAAANEGISAERLRRADYALYADGVKVCAISNTFSTFRVNPTPVSPSAKDGAIQKTAQITFTFSANAAAYTAFQIQVADAAKKLIWTSPTQPIPAAISDYNDYRAPLYVGPGQALADGSNYFWRVTQVNAKYPVTANDDDWSDWTPFATAVDSTDGDTGYGRLAVEVRYYGAATNAQSRVIVGVYETADFTGDPVAKAVLGGDRSVQDLARLVASAEDYMTPVTNVLFDGVSAGAKYVMAFIDTNGNGTRDYYEPWGYLNNVGGNSAGLYTPMTLVVRSTKSETPSGIVFIEDTDANGDGTPDCVEDTSDWPEDPTADTSDADGDGLPSDAETGSYGTDPNMWDTDGDGMPDGWEVWAGTYPNTDDADLSNPNDVMAYREETRTFVTVWDGSDASTKTVYVLAADAAVPRDGDDAAGLALYATYEYGEVYGLGRRVAGVTGRVAAVESGTLALVHAQVYQARKFNALTANATACAAGSSVDTKSFTALDKYLLIRYFDALGLIPYDPAAYASGEDRVNRTGAWAEWSLQPGSDAVDRSDSDGDGVPDGWELYTMFGPTADLTDGVSALDAKISPWNYADARQASPGDGGLDEKVRCTVLTESGYDAETGTYNPTDPWAVDTDGDSVCDYYYHTYCLWDPTGDRDKDADGVTPRPDGLSNYAEYLITEVFAFAKCDPNAYATVDLTNGAAAAVCDYYKRVGDLYLGEMFTDHDRVSDAWEYAYAATWQGGVVSPSASVYDPEKDDDGDGWSNWAEAKAGTDPRTAESVSVDATLPEYPIPAIRVNLSYFGPKVLTGDLNFRAWSEKTDAEMLGAPDAVWSSSAAQSNSVKYVGRNPGASATFTLGTGVLEPGSLKIAFRDLACEKSLLYCGVETTSIVSTDTKDWFDLIEDVDGVLRTMVSTNSAVANAMSPLEVGTVDYETGRVTVDFAKLPEEVYADELNGRSTALADDPTQGVSYNAIKLHTRKSYVRLAWTSRKVNTTGNGTFYLADAAATSSASRGHVREGLNSFLVWCDVAGGTDGAYDAGEPMGFVQHVDVGWQGAEFDVALTETCGITPRIDIWSSTASDRSVTWSESSFATLTDPLATAAELQALSNAVVKSSATASQARLRVVRYGVNGLYAYRVGVGFDVTNIIERVYTPNGRQFLCEADFLQDGELDIEWSSFANEVQHSSGVAAAFPAGVSNVTYLAVLDGGAGYETWLRGNGDSNTVIRALATTIERRFELKKHEPVAEDVETITYAARPTFAWSLPNEEAYAKKYGTSYTAFRLYIFSEDGKTEVYRSNVLRAPAQDKDGVFRWTADVSAGDLVKASQKFPATGNFKWRVSMFNAKYKPTTSSLINSESPSDFASFSMAVNAARAMNDAGYSSVDVAVKYAGPSTVIADYADLAEMTGKVRVQAFASADFAGKPMSEAVVTSGVADFTTATANVRLVGLPQEDTYYIRAYIDTDGDRELDDWESWGAASEPVVLQKSLSSAPVVGVWIEDSDTDQDWLPDAYEWVKQSAKLATAGADVMSGATTIFSKESFNSATNRQAGISTYLEGATLTIFENGSWAKTILNWGANDGITFEDITAAVQKGLTLKENTFRITSMTIVGRTLTLTIDAEVSAASIGSELLSKVYTLDSSTKTVKIRILRKDSLAQKDWEKVGDDLTVTFGEGQQTATVGLGDKLTSAFYKVEIVE